MSELKPEEIEKQKFRDWWFATNHDYVCSPYEIGQAAWLARSHQLHHSRPDRVEEVKNKIRLESETFIGHPANPYDNGYAEGLKKAFSLLDEAENKPSMKGK